MEIPKIVVSYLAKLRTMVNKHCQFHYTAALEITPRLFPPHQRHSHCPVFFDLIN